MVKAIQDLTIDKAAEKKRLSNDRNGLTRKNERVEEARSTDWDELTDLFYEAMANFFPASWSTFYGIGDDDNEQWQLWRRFLQRQQMTMGDIEQICDLLVERGERFAPNQGIVKAALDEVRAGFGKNLDKSTYLKALKDLYDRQFHGDGELGQHVEPMQRLARQAIRDSGGFSWHLDMHSQGKMDQAFSLWRDRCRHMSADDGKAYQEKLTHTANQQCSKASTTDLLMLKHAVKSQGPTPELEQFARSLGVDLKQLIESE